MILSNDQHLSVLLDSKALLISDQFAYLISVVRVDGDVKMTSHNSWQTQKQHLTRILHFTECMEIWPPHTTNHNQPVKQLCYPY